MLSRNPQQTIRHQLKIPRSTCLCKFVINKQIEDDVSVHLERVADLHDAEECSLKHDMFGDVSKEDGCVGWIGEGWWEVY